MRECGCRFLNSWAGSRGVAAGRKALKSSVCVQMWVSSERGVSLLGVLSCPGNVTLLVQFSCLISTFQSYFHGHHPAAR